MPNYRYYCTTCNDSFEEIHKIDDRNLPTETPCPKCSGKIAIQIGSPMVVDPVRLGLVKPKSDFVERMNQIKKGNPKHKMEF